MNEQKNKIDFQKIVQAKNMRAAELFESALTTEHIPGGMVSDDWKRSAMRAMNMSAPIHHRLSLKEFASVIRVNAFEQEITLFQFGVMSNALETVSPDQLDLCGVNAYSDLITEAVGHIDWYQKRMKEIRGLIEMQVESEFTVKAQLDQSKNGGLKPVAEA